MITLLLALTLVQGSGPSLEATLDEERVSVGEDLLYTLRAVSHSPMPMHVSIAPFTGLEIVSRSERSEVSMGRHPTRTTVLEVRLRAVRPGRWQLGPARAVQGRDTVEAPAVVVDVTASRAATASTLSPRLRRLLDRAGPPVAGDAAVDLIVSADSVRVGEQVDVVTAAWFPRDLRLQLRRPPTLQPPVIDGVWSYPQATPAGIAATRSIGGRWYDLFVAHQVVFPLLPGTVVVPRATLKYSTPVALQFFSQEERYALSSKAETLAVAALPDAGRPIGFGGAIGAGLTLERRVSPRVARVGEGVMVELTLSGEGNTALWPSPDLEWGAGARAYSDKVEERVGVTEGRVGGTKTFRYLVVPDSAGSLALPAVSYPYFDLAGGRYLAATLAATAIPVSPGGGAASSTALPPPLMHPVDPGIDRRLGRALPDWGWLLVLIAPPLLVALRRRVTLPDRRRDAKPPGDLRAAEEELEAVVRTLVPDPERRTGAGLAAALRAAGADSALAGRVAAVRERLLARRYGPAAGARGDAALAAEARDVVTRLGGSLRGWSGVAAVPVALALWASVLAAQAPSPEALYEQGSLTAAAEEFAHRAEREPAVAAHWYNLGAAYYRLGQDGRARAAWLQARRLSPRSASIAQALRMTPPPDATSARWSWTPPVSPEELLLLGALGWIAGWLGWTLRPVGRERWLILLVFSAVALTAGLGLRTWLREPLAVVLNRSTLRLSPHGLAPSVAALESGSAVRVLRRSPGWVMVEAPGAQRGWLADEAVAAVGS
ncbi:MAG TPA: BatD family protein [Gemmatimonadales bacterium]|nr:BatD family protein [Gemmatimonadales bacterium]